MGQWNLEEKPPKSGEVGSKFAESSQPEDQRREESKEQRDRRHQVGSELSPLLVTWRLNPLS